MDGAPETHVRLLWIDTPEVHDNAHGEGMPEGKIAAEITKALLPPGSMVRLWGPKDHFESDKYRRTLAAVLIGETGVDSLEERMIRGGWSVYWTLYNHAPISADLRFRIAENAARTETAGCWQSNRAWMIMKKGECTPYPLLDSEEEKKKLADTGTEEVNAWFTSYGNLITPEIKDKMLSGLQAGMNFLDAYESAAGTGGDGVRATHSNEADNNLKTTDPVLWMAKQGDPQAQYTISLQYTWDGLANRQKNLQESFFGCKKSTENGFLFAEYQLGLKYLHGEGVAVDHSEATNWLTKAYMGYHELAEKGDANAMAIIGQIFHRCGNAVMHDIVLAHIFNGAPHPLGIRNVSRSNSGLKEAGARMACQAPRIES
jgi:hypothetical protein